MGGRLRGSRGRGRRRGERGCVGRINACAGRGVAEEGGFWGIFNVVSCCVYGTLQRSVLHHPLVDLDCHTAQSPSGIPRPHPSVLSLTQLSYQIPRAETTPPAPYSPPSPEAPLKSLDKSRAEQKHRELSRSATKAPPIPDCQRQGEVCGVKRLQV